MWRNHNQLQSQGNVHGVGLIATQFASHAKMTLTKKGVALHLNASSKGKGAGKQCFFKWHDENHFGLGKNDRSKILRLDKN
jgi:hypothetical protein